MKTILVDGVMYHVEVTHGGDVVFVYSPTTKITDMVASAEYDYDMEAMYVSYHTTEEGVIATDSLSMTLNPELSDPEELARWLVSTHPANG